MIAEPWTNKTPEQARREARRDDLRAKAEIAIEKILNNLVVVGTVTALCEAAAIAETAGELPATRRERCPG